MLWLLTLGGLQDPTTQVALRLSVSELLYKVGDFGPIDVLECLISFSGTLLLGSIWRYR